MVQVNNLQVNETVWRYRTEGVDKARQDVDRLAGSLDKASTAQGKASDADSKAASAMDRGAQARARYQERLERGQRAIEAEARSMALAMAAQDAGAASLQGYADAQLRASQATAQAAAQQERAANDNAASLERQSSAFAEAGKAAVSHPILVLAGVALVARSLAGLATSAAGSLGAASVATAEYAATSAAMGGTVAAGATVAARGLGVASGAAAAAAPLLAGLAEKASDLASKSSLTYLALRLLGQGLGMLGPLLPVVGLGFAAFETGRAFINKAYADLQKLIDLGQKAQSLDVSAPFLKSFESLGKVLGATTEQMDQALSKASSFLKDTWGQDNNNLSKLLNDITATGAAGPNGLQATALADTATNLEERLKAGLAAMKELDQLGLHLASIQVGEKLFGSETVERMRISSTNAEQLSAALQAATEKEILRQDQVDRAVSLNKNIADTKQGISDALAVNLDFSAAAIRLDETWLSILQTIKSIVEAINNAAKATSDFISSIGSGIQSAFSAFGNLPIWKQINEAMDKMGLMDKDWQKQGQADNALDIKVKPSTTSTITGRNLGYISTVVDGRMPQAAKQAKQAAQEAVSSYDLLIKRTEDRIDELNLEADSVGKTTDAVIKLKLAHDLERAAQKDGTEVTQAMREEWDRLGDRLAASTSRLADNRRAFELLKEGQRELADGFTGFVDDIVLGGQKMEQAFASLSRSLSSSVLKGLISGEGPLAGILGTASSERGQLGGLLGGKISLSSLFGGTSSEAGSPLPGAQGPSLPTASMFGSMFNTDKIASALGLGAETGLGTAVSGWLKESRQGGGILTSPLGQGLTSIAAGGAVGYSSQSPLLGGVSGLLAGAMTGNPLLAAAGPALGIGGHFGKRRTANDNPKPEREKPADDRDQRPLAA